MRIEVQIEKKDIDAKFGHTTIESLAANIYQTFHGDCHCTAHPFEHECHGEFDGTLPWSEGSKNDGDDAVQAFRLAAIAARNTLRECKVGTWGTK